MNPLAAFLLGLLVATVMLLAAGIIWSRVVGMRLARRMVNDDLERRRLENEQIEAWNEAIRRAPVVTVPVSAGDWEATVAGDGKRRGDLN